MAKNGTFVLLMLAVVVVGGMGSYRGNSSRADLYEMLEPVMMPAPDETIIYDDNALAPIPLMDAIDRYWAVRFLPDSFCSLKVGLIATFPMGTFPVCTFFVWRDAFGQPLEPPFYQTTFTISGGLPTWDNILVSPSLVDSLPFWIGYWLPNTGFDPLQQDLPACDIGGPPPGGQSSVSTNRVVWQSVPGAFMGFWDLGIRAWVNYFTLPRHDVMPTLIFGLPETVFCDTGYAIQAEVTNVGDSIETFDVILEIDTTGNIFWADTQLVDTLFPLRYDTVTFVPDWAVPERDSIDYGVLVFTELVGDDSTANDSLTDSTFGYCLWVRDVGPITNLSPPDTGFCDSIYNVQAEITNFGTKVETDLDVEAVIGAYVDTFTVDTLVPGDTVQVDFVPWLAPGVDSTLYQIRYTTLLLADTNQANDTLYDTTLIHCAIRDVGPILVLSPGDTVFCDSLYSIQARVQNFGQEEETFDVSCEIDSLGDVIFTDTKTVTALSPGGTFDVTFTPDWQVPLRDAMDYGITITTLLVGDDIPSNDTLVDTTTSRCLWIRDVGPVAVLSPGDTVYCDSSYTVQARVENFGQQDETFDVSCKIDSLGDVIYNQIETVTGLGPGATEDVTFVPDWQVPLVDAMDYGITITTLLAGDAIPSNDTLLDTTTSKCLWIEDVAAVLVLWPGDTVYCSSSGEPTASVTNLGQVSETFDAIFSIDTSGLNIYEDTVTVSNLAPSETTNAIFATWVVPDANGITYELTFWTMLVGDIDMSNDTLHDSSWGTCLLWEDVYPSQVVWPGDTVLCDSSDTVIVRVVNEGDLAETFDVIVQIDTSAIVIFDDTATVTNLAAGDSTDAVFNIWTVLDVDGMIYGITTWTLLVSDSVPGNDTLVTSSLGYCPGIHDVGALGRVAPPDTVLCEQIYPVWAEVMNYGDYTEDFDVICIIEDTSGAVIYDETTAVWGLDPDSITTAAFDSSWTVPNVDSTWYDITFYTELSLDLNTANDSTSDSVFGYCLGVIQRDVGPIIITAPPDTVFCDSTVSVSAYVKNFGTQTEFFSVECIIDSGLIVHRDTQAVPGLNPGDSMQVNFLNWLVPGADSTVYAMTVVTLLAVDTTNSNDTLGKSIFGYCLPIHDVGIVSIVAPPDTVYVGSSYTPRVDIHNYGDFPETLEVVCTIDGYLDTQQVVDLLPGWSWPVLFTDWDVTAPGSYLMRVRSILLGDANPVNDTATKTVEAVTGLYEQYVLPRVPLESGLLQNAPNPLSFYTQIYYQIAESGIANLSVYDLSGRLVKVLFDDVAEPGYYSVRWEGDDEAGSPVPSGIYIYKLSTDMVAASRKLVVVR